MHCGPWEETWDDDGEHGAAGDSPDACRVAIHARAAPGRGAAARRWAFSGDWAVAGIVGQALAQGGGVLPPDDIVQIEALTGIGAHYGEAG
jgi:hypothetical protein